MHGDRSYRSYRHRTARHGQSETIPRLESMLADLSTRADFHCPAHRLGRRLRHNGDMTSKGKPSPRSAVKPLSDEQVAKLAQRHHLVNPTKEYPTGPRIPNEAEINAQNPKATARLLKGVSVVLSQRSKVYAWGLEHVPKPARSSPPPRM